MARPRSEDRRNAILSAATRVIAAQGLGAPTAAIAKEAGVSNGSLFVYFDTKAALLNELYVVLKSEMATTALAGLPVEAAPRDQVHQMWTQWVRWATTAPDKRRALAQLQMSDDITEQSHQTVSAAFRGIADLLERSRANGPMQDAPLGFLLTLTDAMANAAIDTMIREPDQAESHSRVAFEAVWRVIAGSSMPAIA
ncbi:TetR/AcrR family transcriptional regulator [Actinoallomurus rhizosphaericola]|uniref:TetR/AcrR family transcriptional regulator n=1 Tax=Actinoallomurus rhizosphaericola TaxID=2952536 RepID=UPI0020922D1E|nr:TetR/AcrR family transcriptional regulator [Actinoallomurus rhizosphaericola]MCO5997663.1 TetR/AcrR family transcriptional regulator [Actinoallomurus rhizosphaericola]